MGKASENASMGAGLPVEFVHEEERERAPEEGEALCLSGGGYRAMVFHLGVLWRLYEVGHLRPLKRISSVSGGSITSAVLALAWAELSFEANKVREDFVPLVVEPVRALARKTIDATSVIGGVLTPGTVSDKIAADYDKYLFHGKTLQDLPDEPRFVINSTNVQSGALWRFMKPYMRDWRVGEVKNPTVPVAKAVAASSAFPPVLSPVSLELDPRQFTPGSGEDLQAEPYTSDVVLTDGGVYDNLGLETAFKRYKTILVSNAGGKMQPEEEPKHDWARHAYRVLNIIDNQVRSLRIRQLIEAYKTGVRTGAYWATQSDINNFKAPDALPCPYPKTLELAALPTRLRRMSEETQERLINWGYAVCDAAIRKHVDSTITPPNDFPYPATGVG